MTHALFITTRTNEVENHIRAWECAFGPADRISFDHRWNISSDGVLIEKARETKPDLIFYIGACVATGNPKVSTLSQLREIAPIVNLCSDAADDPWHPVLRNYQARGCFDLQVALDGAREAPVDMAVLTPVDPGVFSGTGTRDIRCGFSGTVGRHGLRAPVFEALGARVEVRQRATEDGYEAHGRFLARCRMTVNMSYTGTGERHHIKGRVLEAGWAGCALLESDGSPIGDWFPEDCYITYRDAQEAAEIIRDASDDLIEERARNLAAYCAAHYHPRQIYGGILERLGFVDSA